MTDFKNIEAMISDLDKAIDDCHNQEHKEMCKPMIDKIKNKEDLNVSDLSGILNQAEGALGKDSKEFERLKSMSGQFVGVLNKFKSIKI